MKILILSVLLLFNVCNATYKDIVKVVQSMNFTVTSTTGGRHNPGSDHYKGRACDVRTKNKTNEQIEEFMQIMRDAGYNVLDERIRPFGRVWSGPHIHISVPKCIVDPSIKLQTTNIFSADEET